MLHHETVLPVVTAAIGTAELIFWYFCGSVVAVLASWKRWFRRKK